MAAELGKNRGNKTPRQSVQDLVAPPSPLSHYMEVNNEPMENPFIKDSEDFLIESQIIDSDPDNDSETAAEESDSEIFLNDADEE